MLALKVEEGANAKECEELLEPGGGRKTHGSLELLEGISPAGALTSAQGDGF